MRFSGDNFLKKISKITLLTTVALTTIFCAHMASAQNLGKIMPLGDSITAGRYRRPLHDELVGGGYTFQFVGSNTLNYDYVLNKNNQGHHEGHPGYRILGNETRAGLNENLNTWIGPGGETPDIILLMIGTNEMWEEKPADSSARLDDLINDIYGYLPNVRMYVASLTFRTSYQDSVVAFNATVPGIVTNYKMSGKDIHYVDMYPVLTVDDLVPDGIHPSLVGYAKIGEAWYDAINTFSAAPVPEPGSTLLLLIGITTLSAIAYRRKAKRPG